MTCLRRRRLNALRDLTASGHGVRFRARRLMLAGWDMHKKASHSALQAVLESPRDRSSEVPASIGVLTVEEGDVLRKSPWHGVTLCVDRTQKVNYTKG